MAVRRLILVRHGETEWNRAGLFTGHSVISLNAAGRRQAMAASQPLVSLIRSWQMTASSVRSVLVSDLPRAQETWKLLAAAARNEGFLFPQYQVSSLLREWNAGVLTGHTVGQVVRRHPFVALPRLLLYRSRPWRTRLPSGESQHDVGLRLTSLLRSLGLAAPLKPEENSITVWCTHGDVARILSRILNVGAESPRLANGGILALEFQEDDSARRLHPWAQSLGQTGFWRVVGHA